jgi:hypothetical protein
VGLIKFYYLEENYHMINLEEMRMKVGTFVL